MRYQAECIGCSKRQGSRIFRFALENGSSVEASKEDALLTELEQTLNNVDPSYSPAELSIIAIRTAQKYAQSNDPFIKQKHEANVTAAAMVERLQQRIKQSDDPLRIACLLAACGNIIDLGVHDTYDLEATVEKVLREGFRLDYFDFLKQDLRKLNAQPGGGQLLYLCDNAGEIVFDKLFIKTILQQYPQINITAVVRKEPILNDATMADAQFIGLTDIVDVIDNGTDLLGTVVNRSPESFQKIFNEADVIISKGQANYETLSNRPENIYFILKAKCDVIAGSLGVKLYDAVMTQLPAQQLVQIGTESA